MGEELTVPASVPACSACVHVVYAAPAACPSEAAFADMVADDGGHATLAAEDDAPTAFHVHIEGSGPFTGRLVVRRDDGTEATRTIPGATCDDVARSLAVLVALATPDGPTPALAPAPAPTLAPAPKPPRPDTPSSDHLPASPPPRTWHLAVSGGATFDKTVGSSELPGFAAYLEWVEGTPRFLGPAVRVGVEVPMTESLYGDVGFGNTYRRLLGRIDACGLLGELSRPWSDDAYTLYLCGRLDVGRLQAVGGIEVDRPWVAPAAFARIRWRSPRVFFDLEGGVSFPLVREDFGFDEQVQ